MVSPTDLGAARRRRLRSIVALAIVAAILPGLGAPAIAGQPTVAGCRSPQVPSRFPSGFLAHGYGQVWRGVFAMTKREMQTIVGPWLSNDPHELILDPTCFAL